MSYQANASLLYNEKRQNNYTQTKQKPYIYACLDEVDGPADDVVGGGGGGGGCFTSTENGVKLKKSFFMSTGGAGRTWTKKAFYLKFAHIYIWTVLSYLEAGRVSYACGNHLRPHCSSNTFFDVEIFLSIDCKLKIFYNKGNFFNGKKTSFHLVNQSLTI